jgi:hypothetical protein
MLCRTLDTFWTLSANPQCRMQITPTFLTKHNQINFELNSVGFSIVKNLPVLPYRRSGYILTDWKIVAKWPEGA